MSLLRHDNVSFLGFHCFMKYNTLYFCTTYLFFWGHPNLFRDCQIINQDLLSWGLRKKQISGLLARILHKCVYNLVRLKKVTLFRKC